PASANTGTWGTAPQWKRDHAGQSGATNPQGDASTNGVEHYYHVDHLGTSQRLTNAQGETTWRMVSEAFGKTFVDTILAPATTGTTTNNLRFPGQYEDQETNTHYNYFRDYDPSTGRYVQSDPIGLAGGINTYGYVKGQPLRFIDPDGLQALPLPIFPIPGMPSPGRPANPTPDNSLDPYPSKPGWTLPPIRVPSWLPDWLKPAQQCKEEREEECSKKLQEDDALCVAIAGPRYGRAGIAICKKSAMERYSECLRSGVNGIRTPLAGVSTPL
ncbi:MAG TPA: hypothetical protein DEX10_12105, partial [Betaproteobacteria bacterium]|nr:hypothetical protein [Betaproteobacteria bacterium]